MAVLYGDGIHDDHPAIQELLDSGKSEVQLPLPQQCYRITRPLRIHSCQSLILPRFAVIRLAGGANCFMLENADPENGNHDFSVTGGIWDFNNQEQASNPIQIPHPELPGYLGYLFHLYHVKNFRIAHLTLKDPVNFCVVLDRASYFTVEDITFDFNHGNPYAVNMDGIHLNGNCHYGCIRNLKGACYDDLVALNSDEGSDGPISHIEVDGIFAEDCHSAARLLSVKNAVEHVHIHNVHGTFYQYCIGITKYYKGKTTGFFDGLVLENIHASKAERYSFYRKDGSFVYPLIWFESGVHVKNAVVRGLYRKERVCPIPTVKIERGAVVENLQLTGLVLEDPAGLGTTLVENDGQIGVLHAASLRSSTGDPLINRGRIEQEVLS